MSSIMKGIVDEEVGGNYLYHSVQDADTAKAILNSGYFLANRSGSQPATDAQTPYPVVSFGRNINYQTSGANVDRDYQVVFVVDRRKLEANYKTLGTSQNQLSTDKWKTMGPRWTKSYDKNGDGKLTVDELPAGIGGETLRKNYFQPKAGGEFEEAVPVKSGKLPLKGILLGFYLVPGKAASKDPELLSNPLRLDMPKPNIFVKAKQEEPVNESENVAVIYIDGKAAAKYAKKHEAERDANFMRERFPNKKIEIKQEVRETELDENLHKWFKEKWVRFGPDGKIRGDCARGDDSEGKPKCLPQKKAHALGKKGRKYAASKKRREDPNPERRGPAKNVATKKKTNEEKCPHCGGELVSEELMNEKQDACYRKVKSRYKVWPSAYASGALVQCRKKGAANWGNKSKANEAAGDTLMDPEYALPQARKITKAIKYDDTVGEIITQIEMLAERTQGIDSRTIQYAIDGVLAAKNALESAVYDLEEAFEDAAREMQFKRDEEELGEDYTGEFAAEKTSETNPYGGQRDIQHRGALGEALLSEMPDTSGPVGVQPGGWRRTDNPGVEEGQIYSTGGGPGEAQRKFRPKSAGMFKEEQLDEKCWDSHKQVGMKKKGGKMVPNCVPKESAIMKGLKR